MKAGREAVRDRGVQESHPSRVRRLDRRLTPVVVKEGPVALNPQFLVTLLDLFAEVLAYERMRVERAGEFGDLPVQQPHLAERSDRVVPDLAARMPEHPGERRHARIQEQRLHCLRRRRPVEEPHQQKNRKLRVLAVLLEPPRVGRHNPPGVPALSSVDRQPGQANPSGRVASVHVFEVMPQQRDGERVTVDLPDRLPALRM